MKTLLYSTLLAIFSVVLHAEEKPATKDVAWENACGGSNIQVTRVSGKLVLIDAFVEHFAEDRQWVCHFKDGKIISAMYKHFTVKRVQEKDERGFTTVQTNDIIKVYHFPDHELNGLDQTTLKDLKELIELANK